MADPVQGNKPLNVGDERPATVNTFLGKVTKALLDQTSGPNKSRMERFLETRQAFVSKFSRLPHTPAGLSTTLHYCIADVAYRYGHGNQAFVSTLTASPELVAKLLTITAQNGRPIVRNITVSRNLFNPRTENDKVVTLFDLEARKLLRFSATEWTILPMTLLPLDQNIADILTECLAGIYDPNRKRQIRKMSGQI